MQYDKKKYILGIDASNIRRGGGITHLKEILNVVNIDKFGFEKIILWSNKLTLSLIDDKIWLNKISPWALNSNIFFRFFWQTFFLNYYAKKHNCSIILIPGSLYLGSFKPYVTISQNMLPFDSKERSRYGFSFMRLKLKFLNVLQTVTFKKANGIIFLTHYAFDNISRQIKLNNNYTIIPHGINKRFICAPKKQFNISNYNTLNRYKIIYVSIVDMYKHQWNIVKAIRELYYEGYPIELILVGGSYKPALIKMNKEINKDKFSKEYIKYYGEIDFKDINGIVNTADLFLFASTCENLPNILIEGMASGLPVLSSYFGPMKEVLNNSGIYFNPENPSDIKHNILKYISSTQLRESMSHNSSAIAKKYSWEDTTINTLNYLKKIANKFYEK